jgi:hypothetical protein
VFGDVCFVPKSESVLRFCRQLMSLTYERPVEREEDLVAGNLATCEAIQNRPEILEGVRQNTVRRGSDFNEVNRRHFKQLL